MPVWERKFGGCRDTISFFVVSPSLSTPTSAYNAIFSTYIVGLTDGATVWSLAISATNVLAIQWPYYIPFQAAYSTASLLFGSWSGTEQSPQFQVSPWCVCVCVWLAVAKTTTSSFSPRCRCGTKPRGIGGK